MSYTVPNGYGAAQPNRAKSLGAAAIIQGAALAAIILIPSAHIITKPEDKPIISYPVPVDPPVPQPRPDPQPNPTQVERKTAPPAPTPLPVPTPFPAPDNLQLPPVDLTPAGPIFPEVGAGDALDDGIAVRVPEPILVGPQLDNRFADRFLPNYPSDRARLDEEGLVRVRVLVNARGRVEKIEQLSTTHPSFWRATERHAPRNWRFEPATRDGEPIAGWMTITVRFTLRDR